MAAVPLAANGSFSGTTSSSGVVGGHPATFTYSFGGDFHSVGADGAARAAGRIRMNVVYTDSTTRTCTRNDMPWRAERTA